MAKGSRRGGRVRDKWRDKQWIIVNAPSAFDRVPLNYIPISDINNAKGRVIENTLYDMLKQDPTQHQTKIFVQIDKINAGMATTIFKGHEYAKEFLRSLIRRGSSMINFVNEYKTSDGYLFRVSSTAFSHRRINTAKKHEIRLAMDNLLKERIPNLTLDEFVKEVTMGKMSNDMMEEAKKIAVIRHVGVRKTKLLSSPLQNEDTSTSNDFTSETSEEISSDSPDNPDAEEVQDETNA
ncbi:MAG: 30S ribosomal protein S3ae [Candidatus Nitrosocosmicus sp.]|jgi:small subunit ribosomal protein S3Ae|uniref:30S ribosomal protein S3ae n=1 Tax=Candidatus Nitrosocosmicus agrestis TaxID=2563600 RepID=UPI00122DE829|nr:30S ribosomal protein S3ae [Candidatus Nitrosocosmicus sp. SS]KAA2281952.1 30S ribosomal protein S3ae [Candidatus Nitrosocosmicus sp. SS]KAF0869857.1 30S ribosomal protein S3ae [Candidatus Nitrosocosmicus sp. SS]MDR4490648.1 30S ribosomal protein S3ae [Candidatus Nitrosocosmicus sp.]HET6589897.1 30S ribosomal protein S3ae [Candidatus Nitrosocosmicus sp.]